MPEFFSSVVFRRSESSRKNANTEPFRSLVPDFVTTERAPPLDPPISASNRLVITRNSLTASWEYCTRESPSSGSVMSTPSTRMVAPLALSVEPSTGPP